MRLPDRSRVTRFESRRSAATADDEEKKFTRLTFPKGAVLLKEGTPGEAAYVIVSGKVEVRKDQFGSNPRTVATRTPGEIVGELALLVDKPHIASVVAVEDTVVNAMSRDEFRRRLAEMDPTMRGILVPVVEWARQMAENLISHKRDVNWGDWQRKG